MSVNENDCDWVYACLNEDCKWEWMCGYQTGDKCDWVWKCLNTNCNWEWECGDHLSPEFKPSDPPLNVVDEDEDPLAEVLESSPQVPEIPEDKPGNPPPEEEPPVEEEEDTTTWSEPEYVDLPGHPPENVDTPPEDSTPFGQDYIDVPTEAEPTTPSTSSIPSNHTKGFDAVPVAVVSLVLVTLMVLVLVAWKRFRRVPNHVPLDDPYTLNIAPGEGDDFDGYEHESFSNCTSPQCTICQHRVSFLPDSIVENRGGYWPFPGSPVSSPMSSPVQLTRKKSASSASSPFKWGTVDL